MNQMNSMLAVGVLTLGMMRGCGCNQQATTPPASTGTFQSRLDAAQQISNVTQKDEALRKVASDAADAGESQVVLTAIKSISYTATKDSAAEASALALAKAGRHAEANEAAKLISYTVTRDKVLKQLAEGK